MPRYDRSFDYGLRGSRAAAARPQRGLERLSDYDREYRERRMGARTPRVTASYNLDYVFGGRGERYPRNYAPYGGEFGVPIYGADEYRSPYFTTGESHTWRGTTGLRGYGLDFARRFPGPRRP